jgi:hypothetical protein
MTLRNLICLAVLLIPTWLHAQDVGVLKGRQGCPNGAPEVIVEMDNEDHHEASAISGWVGATTLNGAGNLTLRFCRTPAAPFFNAPGPFAVLALDNCPPGSFGVRRKFDVEDEDNRSRILPDAWSAWPGVSDGDVIILHFCVFQGVPGGSFPQLGKEYGVFSDALQLPGALEYGRIYSDDEDDYSLGAFNSNRYYYPGNFGSFVAAADASIEVYCCFNGNGTFITGDQLTFLYGINDTTMKVARVTSTPPPTNPVAICNADPPTAVGYAWARFDASSSYARGGHVITSYSWWFYDGTTADGPGPHDRFFTPEPGQSEYFSAQLTVTDNFGETGSTSCGVFVSSDQCSAAGGPACVTN